MSSKFEEKFDKLLELKSKLEQILINAEKVDNDVFQ